MTDTTTEPGPAEEDAPAKKSKLPLILGLVLALAGGGGGFMAVQMGLLGGGEGDSAPDASADAAEAAPDPIAPVAFIPLDPVVIALPGSGGREHLRFSAQLEVPPDQKDAVQSIQPRIIDVLNGYLRAV